MQTLAPTPAVGLVFHMKMERPYTLDGVRHVHTRTDECEVTEVDGDFIAWEVNGTVAEENRPPFAGYPMGGTMLTSSWPLRVADGTITAAV